MATPTQTAGTAAESAAAAATAGFLGWTPETNRVAYKAGSSTKGPHENAAIAGTPQPRFYR
jgi:hypothetical protein